MWFGKKYEYIYNMGDDNKKTDAPAASTASAASTAPAPKEQSDFSKGFSNAVQFTKDTFADTISAVAGREIAKNVGAVDPDVKGDVSINPDTIMTPETENKDSDKKSSEEEGSVQEKKDDKSVEKGSEKNKPEEENEELSTVEKIKKGFSLAKEAYKSLKKGDFNTFVDKANELRKMTKKEFGQFIQENKISIKKTDQTKIFNELQKKNNIFSKKQQQKSSDNDEEDNNEDNEDGNDDDDNDDDDNDDDDNEEDGNDNKKKKDSYVADENGNLPFVISGMMNEKNEIISISSIDICEKSITDIKVSDGKIVSDSTLTKKINSTIKNCQKKGGKKTRHKKIHKSKKQIKRFLRKTKQNKKSL
jgi:hypothetical protein